MSIVEYDRYYMTIVHAVAQGRGAGHACVAGRGASGLSKPSSGTQTPMTYNSCPITYNHDP